MAFLDEILRKAQAQPERWLETAIQFLSIPSISTLPERAPDVRRAADWLAERLLDLGFETEIVPTPRHPIVYAHYTASNPQARTALVYGHYDVQPVDPLDAWHSPPFQPTLEGDFLYARGAMDMKGQIAAFLCALQCLKETSGIPLNLTCVFEGEEEIGSPDLRAFLVETKDRLRSDVVLNLDGLIFKADVPSLVYGLRGLAYLEIELQSLEHDLHSGLFGGTLLNPAALLCRLLADLHTPDGRIALPGFYDAVQPLSPAERAGLALLPHDDAEYLEQCAAVQLAGEPGFTTVERRSARPALEISGIHSGFTGVGAKTIIPAQARAKLTFRLVPNQTPEVVQALLHAFLEEKIPPGVRWRLSLHSSGLPILISREQPAMQTALQALQDTFHTPPVFIREGGTVPVVSLMKEVLGSDSILLGCGVAEDGMHAPNERLRLPLYWKTIELYLRFLCGISTHS
jgi:acetylornithine deacetylase/succinyl-diaminopimelate desuccinylase-like protein